MKQLSLASLALAFALTLAPFTVSAYEKGPLEDASFEQWFDASRATRLSTMTYWAVALLDDELATHNDRELGTLAGMGVECVANTYEADPDAYFSPRIIGVKCLRQYIEAAR